MSGVVRCGSKKGHHKDVFKEVGLLAQYLLTIVGLKVNILI